MIRRIAILGAGPAGSAAAIRLARAGFEITIFERSAFPRAKVCGEFISPGASSILKSILTPAALLSCGARQCREFILSLDDQERVFPLPAPAWALSRATLD